MTQIYKNVLSSYGIHIESFYTYLILLKIKNLKLISIVQASNRAIYGKYIPDASPLARLYLMHRAKYVN